MQKKSEYEELEKRLQSAVDCLTPDILDRLDLSVPQEGREEKPLLFMKRKMMTAAAAAACVCIGAGGGWFQYQYGQIASVVTMDVNPSIQMSLNRRDKVLKAEALNDDGQEILAVASVKGQQLETAVDRVISSMNQNGYLKQGEDADNVILITVSSKQEEKTEDLRQNVSGRVETSLADQEIEARVYSQQLESSESTKALAEEWGISEGKAYFVQNLSKEEESLSEENIRELAPMTMTEITGVICEETLELGQKVVVAEVGTYGPASSYRYAKEQEITEPEPVDQPEAIIEESVPSAELETIEEEPERAEVMTPIEPEAKIAVETEPQIQEAVIQAEPVIVPPVIESDFITPLDPPRPEQEMAAATASDAEGIPEEWPEEPEIATPSDAKPECEDVLDSENCPQSSTPSDAEAPEETDEDSWKIPFGPGLFVEEKETEEAEEEVSESVGVEEENSIE